jgi:hypothetical protein
MDDYSSPDYSLLGLTGNLKLFFKKCAFDGD